jgi:hypothetical protein
MTGLGDVREQFEKDPWPVVGFLTAEHASLTSARATSVSEGNARVSSYLTTLSASLVALGFVATGSGGFSRAFFAFAAVLLAVCELVGLLTFRRCVQISSEDLHLLSRLEQVRATYLELLPGLGPTIDPPTEPGADVRQVAFMNSGPWSQLLLTMAGLVGVVNSALAGAVTACVAQATIGRSVVSWIVGATVVIGALATHLVSQMKLMNG